MGPFTLIGACLFFATAAKCQTWNSPYYSNAGTNGISFRESGMPAWVEITMIEEIKAPFRLIKINYLGSVNVSLDGISENEVDIGLEKEADGTVVIIKNRQDYENSNQRSYKVGLNGGGQRGLLIVTLTNIFDNAPTATATFEGTCKVKELQSNYNTNCFFEIVDADGLTDNRITMTVSNEQNANNYFEFRQAVVLSEYKMGYELYIKNELHYEDRAFFNFETTITDIAKNSRSFKTMVEVIDVPNKDPIWVKPFATATFPEKKPMEFEVKAIDGDTGINADIYYSVQFDNEDYGNFIKMEEKTGKLKISSIDRDALKQEIFPFTIYAYKSTNRSSVINSTAMIVVDDINDNYPEIYMAPTTVEFKEATYLSVPFTTFAVRDIDLGDHAQYEVFFSEMGGISYSDAFQIVPSAGYQNSTFTMTVTNSTLLDYEDENWRSFPLKIVSKETKEPTHYREQVVNVKLINWNDERPIFNELEYSVSVMETVGKGVAIARVLAEDRDVGDRVRYKLVGSLRDLEINADTGEIKTSTKTAFDYERQSIVMIQIEASDTLRTSSEDTLHTSFSQLTVNVIDVNDETPEIRMPREAPTIWENSAINTEVTSEIEGKDPDTDTDLSFQILWNETYAKKSGMMADPETYKNCFIIQTIKDDISPNDVKGVLKVNRRDIDYEMYEVIYLAIRLTDKNQKVNEGSVKGMLTIQINDVNDNAPQFINETIWRPKEVPERAKRGTMIGTITAVDNDGPSYSNVSYFIRPTNENTPMWVEIDQTSGVIQVKDDDVIDCDDPIIYDLEYNVSATDGEFITTEMIKIWINDENNKSPQILPLDTIEKYENITPGELITTIKATDIDRDPPHNVLLYALNLASFPNLADYFEINDTTGDIIANRKGSPPFDRDIPGGEYHTIHVIVEDNYHGSGRKNTETTHFDLRLLDVNDNAPEMPKADVLNLVASESLLNGSKIGNVIEAYDRDDPDTPNAKVQYQLLKIVPVGDNSEKLEDGSYDQLFYLQTVTQYVSTQIYAGNDLKGFYGDWNVTIRAYDLGNMWHSRVSLASNETYTVRIQPYNFNTPKIVFPDRSSSLRLRYDNQEIGRPLKLYDGSELQSFEAEDDDGGEYGNVRFEIDNYGTSDDAKYFQIVRESRHKSRLQLVQDIDSRSYHITLRATDSEKEDVIENLKIVFVDRYGDPFFENKEMETSFHEHWFNETQTVLEATDPKNEALNDENERYPIYYYIDTSYNPEDAEFFKLDKSTRELRVAKEIDRDDQDLYKIKVITTNGEFKPEVPEKSQLYVSITIEDINDKPPKFEHETYSGGITTNDGLQKQILKVHANDPDLEDYITYKMNPDDIITKGSNIESIKKDVFMLDENSGVLYLARKLISEMNGYFSFPIKAYDAVQHEDTCNIKIYIVSESNKVQYLFWNDYQALMNNSDFVRSTLQELYEYEICNIDDIVQAEPRADDQSSESLNQTNLIVHFINNSEVIGASDIEDRNGDIKFLRTLQNAFRERSLILSKVPLREAEATKTMEDLLVTILGVITGVLCVLCVVLVVAFVMKTRRLNKQIEAFAPPDFGSTSSNLNRIGVPTSNIFSVEGSNPVLNNSQLQKDVFDTQSVDSDESDFAGINTDPNFIMEPSERRISELSASTDNTDYTYKNSILSVNQFHDNNFGKEKF